MEDEVCKRIILSSNLMSGATFDEVFTDAIARYVRVDSSNSPSSIDTSTYVTANTNQQLKPTTTMRINYHTGQHLSDEPVTDEALNYAIQSTKLELQSHILATQKSLAECQHKLAEAKTEYPLNCQKIIELQGLIDGHQRSLNTLLALNEEFGFKLFPVKDSKHEVSM